MAYHMPHVIFVDINGDIFKKVVVKNGGREEYAPIDKRTECLLCNMLNCEIKRANCCSKVALTFFAVSRA